ncbi:class I adenylate-forming enzyme family protein [Candidatus Viadribacter manganicus]|uniref:4-coumarate--CoA ligase n=1 Tax=Candidatus Viadribacter manganicus TaxID=1759059 RepID=A0A1B1AHA2_9PROT|nr:class I adenylate-forming enzyme family protein [Candidatus Viadribacter manganicus]ANP45935.1 4-coumarate--CoA ligase [Candidatus Viadribacter manganicus]
MSAETFKPLPEMVHAHAERAPSKIALIQDEQQLSYGALDTLMDRVAAALQRDGLAPRDSVAICAGTSSEYAAAFLGALRAGVAVAPIAPSSTADSIVDMIADCGAKVFFVDRSVAEALGDRLNTLKAKVVGLDDGAPGTPFSAFLARVGSRPAPVAIHEDMPFNIIYSSGTTGTPKGIVQSHGMRFGHVMRAAPMGYGENTVALLSTPLYSNTTLVSFFPAIGWGGAVVLMKKFDAAHYLELAQRHRATHTMLVPVQYSRLMAREDFDSFDLSAFQMKFCTSAPFSAALKADVLKRWPGGLVEYFGMTEGGGTCVLIAHVYPDKLHTVGTPAPGHDIRIIDEDGRELPRGEVGELVGRSELVMSGYHNRKDQTDAATWVSPDGLAFIRTGDVGRFDADGFVELMDRKKDMIISGGFNIYPSDLEAVLRQHPDVADVAVVGVPSADWGETPVAFVVSRGADAAALKAFANERVGKTQRISDVRLIDELPRSHIGKILKRELRDAFAKS